MVTLAGHVLGEAFFFVFSASMKRGLVFLFKGIKLSLSHFRSLFLGDCVSFINLASVFFQDMLCGLAMCGCLKGSSFRVTYTASILPVRFIYQLVHLIGTVADTFVVHLRCICITLL
jgi:hypothetical protein